MSAGTDYAGLSDADVVAEGMTVEAGLPRAIGALLAPSAIIATWAKWCALAIPTPMCTPSRMRW
ncbi:hypothetical protein [Streptomyces sp. NPDC046862]|uniref:hypothetical protein n=1 Tax=Streptomyces sp. NPDC046862 TaxID=3154603 RepID=UPI003452B5FE